MENSTTATELIEVIDKAMKRMEKYEAEGKASHFYVAQEELRVLSSFAYTQNLISKKEYERYKPNQYRQPNH